jgi:hypothetical protein
MFIPLTLNQKAMNNENLKELFKEADEDLERARNELYQPSGDVVNYAVCVSARSALHRFMTCLYVIHARENSREIKSLKTVDEMASEIKKYSEKLDQLDFDGVHCSCTDVMNREDIFYCNDVNKVKYCTDLADSVRDLVLEKSWGR